MYKLSEHIGFRAKYKILHYETDIDMKYMRWKENNSVDTQMEII